MTEIKLPAKWLKERGIEVSLMLDTGEFVVVGKDTSGYVRTFGYRQHNTGRRRAKDDDKKEKEEWSAAATATPKWWPLFGGGSYLERKVVISRPARW